MERELEAGLDQLVLLGGGWDLMLPEHEKSSECLLISADQPSTLLLEYQCCFVCNGFPLEILFLGVFTTLSAKMLEKIQGCCQR